MLCDTAQGYTQSHSDKPDCVGNDYSPAITLTPPRPTSTWQSPYIVAPVQGNCLTEKDGDRTAAVAKCAAKVTVGDSDTAREKGLSFLVTSSFLVMAVFRNHRVEHSMTRKFTRKEVLAFSLGAITKKVGLKMPSCLSRGCFVKMSGQVTQQGRSLVM